MKKEIIGCEPGFACVERTKYTSEVGVEKIAICTYASACMTEAFVDGVRTSYGFCGNALGLVAGAASTFAVLSSL